MGGTKKGGIQMKENIIFRKGIVLLIIGLLIVINYTSLIANALDSNSGTTPVWTYGNYSIGVQEVCISDDGKYLAAACGSIVFFYLSISNCSS